MLVMGEAKEGSSVELKKRRGVVRAEEGEKERSGREMAESEFIVLRCGVPVHPLSSLVESKPRSAQNFEFWLNAVLRSTTMIPIAFDVLGTCYSLDAASEAIQMAFGQQALARANVNPAFVNMIVEDWFHTSQRDFTYTSMNGHYMSVQLHSAPFGPELSEC